MTAPADAGRIPKIDDHLLATGGTAADVMAMPRREDLDAPPAHRAERPTVSGREKLADLIALAWARIAATNGAHPWLFRASGELACVEPGDETGRLQIRRVTVDRLRARLADLFDWAVPAGPPEALLRPMVADPDPDLPKLRAIVSAPLFLADGTLCATPGYSGAGRVIYQPADGFRLPPVPAAPTDTDVAAARGLLLEDLLADFPFVGDAERAHALGLLLLPFVRGMIDGPTPLHLVEAPTPRTGKGLLATVLLWPALGRAVPITPMPHGDDELRKKLTTALRSGRPVICFDNVQRRLQEASLMAALTTPDVWTDRLLGQSNEGEWLVRCTWVATANNPRLTAEAAGRVARIRIDARLEYPGQRTGFRHPDLRAWVTARRADLVRAALTLVQAWIARGRPRAAAVLGGFEEWSALVGGILAVAGVPGFLGNVEEVLAAAEDDIENLTAFLQVWWAHYAATPVTATALVPLARDAGVDVVDGRSDRTDATRLGLALGRVRGRVAGIGDGLAPVTIVRSGTRGRRVWSLVPEDAA